MMLTRASISATALFLFGCGGSMTMKKPEQGLSGAFSVTGPPEILLDCAPLSTQAEKDSCRRENGRVIEAPWHGTLVIRNLSTRTSVSQALDAEGKYRVNLDPGDYEVCVEAECSDPLEIRMGKWATYGQRLPRPAVKAAAPAKPGVEAASSMVDTASASR